MKLLEIVEDDCRLARVETEQGRKGWMIWVGTPHARLHPKGRYKWACPSCGRFIKPKEGRCRDCLCSCLSDENAWDWARRILERRALERKRLTFGESQRAERALIEGML